MLSQTYFGMPRRCYNRNCRAPFYRESHLGWMPKSELEVIAVMRCPKCRDTFAVVQIVSMVHEYYEKLPKDPQSDKPNRSDITLAEMKRVRKLLDTDPNPLASLFEGLRPGSGFTTREEG